MSELPTSPEHHPFRLTLEGVVQTTLTKHRLRSLFAQRIELLAFGRLQAMGPGLDQGWRVRRRPGRGEALVQGGMMMLPPAAISGSISAAWQNVTFAALK